MKKGPFLATAVALISGIAATATFSMRDKEVFQEKDGRMTVNYGDISAGYETVCLNSDNNAVIKISLGEQRRALNHVLGSTAFEKGKNLDSNGDGIVTQGEVKKFLAIDSETPAENIVSAIIVAVGQDADLVCQHIVDRQVGKNI